MQFRLPLILCSCFLIAFGANAQESLISGVLFNKSSTQRVSNAIILNRRTQASAMSNNLGLFQIRAAVGDTLRISKSGYIETDITVLPVQDVVIQMQPVIEIDEVTVTGQSKKQEMDEVRNQYRKQGSYHAGKPPLLSFIFNPLTAVYELIGKTPGRARRFNNYYYRELEQLEIDRRFNEAKVKELTNFGGEDLRNFMDTYRPQYQELSRWEEYGLVNYIQTSARAFDAAGRPPATDLPPLPKAPDLSDKPLKN